MTSGKLCILILTLCAILGCSSGERLDDKAVIETIADDIERGVNTGDLLKIEKHLSMQAKRDGFEANRFLMLSSYGAGVAAELTARTVTVMGDSAHLSFVLMPAGMQYSDSLSISVVRLFKTDTWKIASFHLIKNQAR